jgi:hypothetical protein
MAIVGDSHGEHLFLGLAEALKGKENLAYYQYTCRPLYGLHETKACEDISATIDYFASDPNIKSVILADYWSQWFEIHGTEPNAAKTFETSLTLTLERLSEKKIYIALDIPIFPFDPTLCVKRPFASRAPRQCTIPRSDFENSSKAYRASIANVVSHFPSVTLLDLAKFVCNDQTCSMREHGTFYYRDNSHLSVDGSKYIGGKIASEIELSLPVHANDNGG